MSEGVMNEALGLVAEVLSLSFKLLTINEYFGSTSHVFRHYMSCYDLHSMSHILY